MVDMTAIAAAFTCIKTATDIAKGLQSTENSFEKAEAQMKLANLMSSLAEIKSQTANIQIEMLDKDQEIRELKEALKTKSNLEYEAPYYWLMDGDKKDGPYCQKCIDDDDKLIRLQKEHRPGMWNCDKCKSRVRDQLYTQPNVSVPNIIR